MVERVEDDDLDETGTEQPEHVVTNQLSVACALPSGRVQFPETVIILSRGFQNVAFELRKVVSAHRFTVRRDRPARARQE